MWVSFSGAGPKAPRPLILLRCQRLPRLSKRLNSAERRRKLNSRWGGRAEGRQGRKESKREKKRALLFTFIFFKSIFFFFFFFSSQDPTATGTNLNPVAG